MAGDSLTIVRVTREPALAHEWELVLLAQGLAPAIRRTEDGVVLSVPPEESDAALAALAAYETETARKAEPRDRPKESFNLPAGAALGFLLLSFFALTEHWNWSVRWLDRGSAHAGRILEGEMWRAVTALTLHGDAAHALSNALALAIFFGAAAGQVGVGLAAALILLAGAAGNLANSLLQGSPHNSVGASTAVFGALGILGSLAVMRHRREVRDKRRAWVIVGAALALLGMLGAGQGRVDVLAHLLGFLAGGVVGLVVALAVVRSPGLAVQWICGAAAFAVIVCSWLLALR
jgi:membrane associated rhomboid family serine protease